MSLSSEYDLIVVGSGVAGMTAALVGAIEGMDVLLCEKSALIGGTTATSAGTAWIPGSSQSLAAGIPDSKEQARTYLAGEIGSTIRDDLMDAFLASGPEAIDYLERHSEVAFEPMRDHQDYHPNRPGATRGGRALAPRPFDGRRLGSDFNLIRPPRDTLMLFGGMMVGRREVPDLLRPFASPSSFLRVTSILLRHAADRIRYPRGTRLILGNALVARFAASLKARNVRIALRTNLVRLSIQEGRVAGAVLESDGATRTINARHGVILATGGFAASASWRGRFLPGIPEVRCYAFAESTGDGLAAASAVGAAIDDGQKFPAWFTPVSVLRRKNGTEAIWAHHSLDRGKPGLIAVDYAGRRFVNEGLSYHDFVVAMLARHNSTTCIPAYLICDRRFVYRYGLGLIRPRFQLLHRWIDRGYVVCAPTLTELAVKLGVDPVSLTSTVKRNNELAREGVDRDFGKGSEPMSLAIGDPSNRPNPCLGEISQPPFVALPVFPGIIGTSIGLATTPNSEVLSAGGRPIPGLYACGNDMASLMRGAYPGPGITIGPAIAFAYRALMHIRAHSCASTSPAGDRPHRPGP